jgi:hypothetical protein
MTEDEFYFQLSNLVFSKIFALRKFWLPTQGLNLEPPDSESGTLPVELVGNVVGFYKDRKYRAKPRLSSLKSGGITLFAWRLLAAAQPVRDRLIPKPRISREN